MGIAHFHSGDAIQGTVLGQRDFGITLDAHFSVVAVRLADGTVIKVCVFRDKGHEFGMRQGETFRANVSYSIFDEPPFTTESHFMLSNVVIEPEALPKRPSAANSDNSRNPLAWLNRAIDRTGRFDM